MSSLALISQKGGVGKTSIAVNLSYSLAKRGWRILLVDADLQGGVGFSLTEKAKDAVGYHDFLCDLEPVSEEAVSSAVLHTRLPGLSLLTRGSRRSLDAVLADSDCNYAAPDRIAAINEAIAAQGNDLVIFDAPTGVHPVSAGISLWVDALLVPQQPGPLCLRSLPQILRMVATARGANQGEDRPRLAGFLLSMTDADDPSNLDDQREFRDLLPTGLVLETVVPIHRDIREASRIGVTVAMLRERPSASSLIFDQLAAELETRLNLYEEDDSTPPQRDDYARLVD